MVTVDMCHIIRDTVASVGVLTGRSLPFTTTNTTIKTFRHALSLDEVSHPMCEIKSVCLILPFYSIGSSSCPTCTIAQLPPSSQPRKIQSTRLPLLDIQARNAIRSQS